MARNAIGTRPLERAIDMATLTSHGLVQPDQRIARGVVVKICAHGLGLHGPRCK